MKRLVFLISFLLASAFAFSQSYDFKQIVQKVNTQTDLTDDQKSKILTLSSEYYPKANEIQNSKASDEMKLLQALALKSEFDSDLKKILTSVQYKKYQEMCDEYEKKYRNRMKK